MLKINEVNRLYLGIQGENNARSIEIDMKEWVVVYPNASVSIWHRRNGDAQASATGAVYDPETGVITWTLTNTDTYVAGEGLAEIRLTENGVIKKTGKVITGVSVSVTGAGTPLGSDWQSYIDIVEGYKNDAQTAQGVAEDAAEDAEDSAEDAEAWAVGKRGGVDVESTDPAYNNNAFYYSGLAAGSAVSAGNAKTAAETAQGKAEEAQGKAETAQGKAESAMRKYPKIDDGTGDWMVWDPADAEYDDTGVHAQGDTGETPDISVGTVETLLPGESAYVELDESSTPEAPVFNFGIPKGDTGTAENIYGNTIDMSENDSTKVATAIGNKADKVTSPTSGNFAALDSNGNLTDSGHKHSDYVTDVSGKADKVSGATSGNFAALDGNGNLTDSGHKHSDYLTSHQDISGKADKVSGATNGNFAALDSNGNLTDSGHKHSDYITDVSGKKNVQTAVSDPSASGTTDEFIATISQNTNGEITPTKKTVQDASQSVHGLMSASDKTKLDNLSQSTLREVPVAVAVADWTLSDGVYSATFLTAYVTSTSKEWLVFDDSYKTYAKNYITSEKKSGGGGIVLQTTTIPTGTITGTLSVIDNDDGKVPVLIEDTTVAIANGGTGQSSLAGAQSVLGITSINTHNDRQNGTKLTTASKYNSANIEINNDTTPTSAKPNVGVDFRANDMRFYRDEGSGWVVKGDIPYNISDQIAKSSISTGYSGLYVEKFGSIVVVTIDGISSVGTTLYTLPSGWRPSHTARGMAKVTGTDVVCRILVDTTGEIKLADATGTAGNFYGEIVFVAS